MEEERRSTYLLSLPGSSVTAVTGTVTVPFSAAATAESKAFETVLAGIEEKLT
jgi:hypothetical protein